MPRFQDPILLFDSKGNIVLEITSQSNAAQISLGGNGLNGDIKLYNASTEVNSNAAGNSFANQPTIHLSSELGDIILSNADCAEEFDIADPPELVDAGTVMVLDDAGALRRCDIAFDRHVVGIVSGAGAYRPAIVLDRKPSVAKRLPIALAGKTYRKVDATFGAIRAGDLLTTSPTPGHAMKADDPFQAFGAVLGKALQ